MTPLFDLNYFEIRKSAKCVKLEIISKNAIHATEKTYEHSAGLHLIGSPLIEAIEQAKQNVENFLSIRKIRLR